MEHLRITVNGKTYDVVVEKMGEPSKPAAPTPAAPAPAPAPVAARAAVPAAPVPAAPRPQAAGAGVMSSPLAGIVQKIDAEVGVSVAEGQLVLTLEAMKMFTPINAHIAGAITAVHVRPGEAVEEGQPLFTIG